MNSFINYRMERKPRSELTTGLVLYGETKPAEMQIESLWKIVDRRTGEELIDPSPDFSEFSSSDRMYPSMMKPEVKRRWDRKQLEWEETKAMHARLKRMVHAWFMQENPDLPVVQGLKKTSYGNEIRNEFKKHFNEQDSMLKSGSPQPRTPQTGTGQSIRDEMERDNVDSNEIADEVLRFLSPKTENTYAVLAVNRDENLRIKDKILVSAESSHALEYKYDEEGRLQAVQYNGEPVEVYHYNQSGQRIYSHVSGGDKQEYRYNNHGQLVQAESTIYIYDEEGFLSEKNSPEGSTRYEYLQTGQLCEVHLPDGTDIKYHFDERGFRTARYINGQLVQRYQWKDLTTLAAAEDAEGISRFHYNEHGRCMGMERNSQVFLFATDQLGSVFTVADSSGNSVQEILYDSFGRRIQVSNPEQTLVLGFGGGLYDCDTGLIHFGYREYDPIIGRFISPDPLGYDGGDVDVYGYCLDDPINFVDRLGLWGVGGFGGGWGSDDTSSKSSAQNARDMESKAESLGYNSGLNSSSGGESSPSKSSAEYAREMEAKAKSLGYNTGLNNSRGDGESSPTKSSAQHAREMEQIARAKAQKEHEAEKAKLAEQKAIRDRRAKEVEERRDKFSRLKRLETGGNIMKRALKNGGKWSVLGATAGSTVPGFGTLTGGIVGGVAGFTTGLLEGTINEGVNQSDLPDSVKNSWGVFDSFW